MPNNCSTLIQRKQNILHKILRSSSDGKIQNAITETTAELCVAGTRKTPAYSPTSTNHLTASSTTRRLNTFNTNRIQPSSNHFYDTHLPSIRDTNDNVERQQNQIFDELHDRSHSKKPSMNTSPKSVGRPPSTSISSIFNALTKRSTENFMSTYGDFEEVVNPSAVPTSRRSQQSHKGTATKQTIVPQKQTSDNVGDIRFSNSSGDINQQRTLGTSARHRTNIPQIHVEPSLTPETTTKERTNTGQHYQRRTHHTVKTPMKQKIDKYRRRSEEATQATNGNTLMNATNNGLSATVPSLTPSPLARSKQPPPSPTTVRRVSSDAELEARLEVLRLSMDTNFIHTDQQPQSQSHQYSNNRNKSSYLSNTYQQITPKTSTSNPPTPPVRFRRNHGPTQPTSSGNSSRQQNVNNINNRPTQQQQQRSIKQLTKSSSGNLYLAFIASRHFSTIEDSLFECNIDHQKLLNIFTWLKDVEDHRHEQLDHEQLLNEQNQRMLDHEENLSLYSEIQFAVDDVPPNTTGKLCEKIETIQFEN
ncbi:unnamed protein product [Rotaria sordida]|uniref:Uncharacterized protein n=1 Tax=Rotaria sordida TaxID=392033 RepID=A0A813Q3C7_9BILA|nr:unnamed protein product [Rotaria sordida]CAF3534898.1 unnamed protein product [Rotaria sordida]